MKTILIPTDFTIESLNTVKGVFKKNDNGEQVNLILLHAVFLSDSITDRLFYSKEKHLLTLQSEKFREACQVLLNTYASRVNSFRIELFSGFTKQAFANFLEANEVNELVIPGTYTLKLASPRSFDPIPYFKKCSLPITVIHWQESYCLPEKDRVAELFLMTNHV
jgi:hypothetical protein